MPEPALSTYVDGRIVATITSLVEEMGADAASRGTPTGADAETLLQACVAIRDALVFLRQGLYRLLSDLASDPPSELDQLVADVRREEAALDQVWERQAFIRLRENASAAGDEVRRTMLTGIDLAQTEMQIALEALRNCRREVILRRANCPPEEGDSPVFDYLEALSGYLQAIPERAGKEDEESVGSQEETPLGPR